MAKFKCNQVVYERICYDYFKKLGHTDTIIIPDRNYSRFIITVKPNGEILKLYEYSTPYKQYIEEIEVIETIEELYKEKN